MAIDVTDATFETEVINRSHQTPVVVDLWANWCGPCKTLGPILEKVCDATGGKVVLAKVDVDQNPGLSQAFQVQSIPAVYAIKDGKVIDGFMGAYPEHVIQQFVESLLSADAEVPTDEDGLRELLAREPGNEQAVRALAELLVLSASDRLEEVLRLLARIPETDQTRRLAAAARRARAAMDAPGAATATADSTTEEAEEPAADIAPDDSYDAELGALLEFVKADEEARQKFLDILAVMGPDDPRTAKYRKLLTHRLY